MAETMHTLNARLNRLIRNGKNVESQGVIRKIKRQIRNLEKTQ